ncbi:MAG: glycosyltransferase [Pseudomonadota bacterium]|nr:glycosyltransferase [Pseudomonadota bacterium]
MWPDIFIESLPPGFRYPGKILLKRLFREASRTCAAAAAVTGITDAFVDWGVRKAGRKRTVRDISFPMGYPKEDFSKDEIREAESFWDDLGIYAGKGFVACFLGSFGRQLDVECLIQAARILKNRRRSIKFVLCGAGDYLERYRRMADDVPEVIFPGWIDAATMHVLMRRSSVGLDPLPNRYDFLATINNKAIEYMSAGLPVISSPRNGVLHDLLKRKACGAGYASGNAEELATLLSAIRDSPDQLKTWSRNAAALFEETFVAEKVYDRMSAYLEDFATSVNP